MTNPNDPYADDPTQRFGQQPNLDKTQGYRPTEQYPLGEQQQYGQPYGAEPYPDAGYHTSDPYAAYGSNPPNDTRALPTAYGGYEQQWGPGGPPPPGGQQPFGQQPPPGGGSSKAGMWVALAAVVALVAAVGLGAFLLFGNSNDDEPSTAASTTTSERSSAPSTTRRSSEATLTPEFTIPDIPLPTDILNDIGLVSGTITAIDGDTITIDPALGSVTKIRTSNSTFVLTTSGTSVADLAVGQEITAQGDVTGDTLDAQFITDISIGIPN